MPYTLPRRRKQHVADHPAGRSDHGRVGNGKALSLYRTERCGVIGHRLVRIANRNAKDVLLARGDADQGAGESVAAEQFLGNVIAVERNGHCI
jgi:hypothetical protein